MTETDQKTLLGHPIGLFVLFFTEMWERFSYYGMRVLLVLYMTKELIINARDGKYIWGFEYVEGFVQYMYGEQVVQALASHFYGLYTFLVYCTPLLGGYIADRFIGQNRSIVLGGILMTIGHFLMAFESLFFLALVFLIFGNGFFKPNISTQVGSLYPEGDPRRDGAFTIFYMGINLGALLSPLICGTLGEVFGYHYGFTAAGVGMVIGLFIYLWGQKYIKPAQVQKAKRSENVERKPLTKDQWKAIAGLVVLSLSNIFFWGIFEQQGNTMQLFSTDHTDWSVGSLFTMPSTFLQFLNPFFIFVSAPILMWLWAKQGDKQMSSIGKMAFGCLLLGVSFIFLIFVTRDFSPEMKMSFMWFVPTIMTFTVGELFFSPIGLSLVTKVAPPNKEGLLMGFWFFSVAFGNYFGGYLGTWYSKLSKPGFFTLCLVLGVGIAAFVFILKRPLQKVVGSDV